MNSHEAQIERLDNFLGTVKAIAKERVKNLDLDNVIWTIAKRTEANIDSRVSEYSSNGIQIIAVYGLWEHVAIVFENGKKVYHSIDGVQGLCTFHEGEWVAKIINISRELEKTNIQYQEKNLIDVIKDEIRNFTTASLQAIG